MNNHVFFVNAFSADYYKGNTAAVVLLDDYPADAQMLALAKEFGFSETCFVKWLNNAEYHIRWFTPEVEVPLCGHATLAAAKSLFALREADSAEIRFNSLSGVLIARRKQEYVELDFPLEKAEPVKAEPEVLQAIGAVQPIQILSARNSRNLILVYADPKVIPALKPDFARLRKMTGLTYFGIAVTAWNEDSYVCRYFAPWEGINEDPVTGSAQTYLAPFWADKMQQTELTGYQLSERGGFFKVEVLKGRVLISGEAFIYLRGEIPVSWQETSLIS